jgi:hypothetical protein
LEALVDAGFDPEALLALAPLLKDALRDELPDALCLAGSDPLSTPAGAGGGALEVRWREIEDASVWASEHNAACAAVAVGTCASELGLAGFGPAATCEQWDSLSEALGASPGGSGGSASDIGAFFGGRGYCQHVAYDGPLESACEEAAAALGRGCNVFLVYTGAGGRHMEHVDGVAVDATPDTRCTARTLSWGRSSTTTYEGRGAFTIGGKFSGKADGARYGAESYLAGEGEGLFVYYCPC